MFFDSGGFYQVSVQCSKDTISLKKKNRNKERKRNHASRKGPQTQHTNGGSNLLKFGFGVWHVNTVVLC